jgi:hypothetical protein
MPSPKLNTEQATRQLEMMFGNDYWAQRIFHGRKLKIKDAKELLLMAMGYFKRMANNKEWESQMWVGKDGNEVKKKTKTPYTLEGLCNYIGITYQTFQNYKNRYRDNKEKKGNNYSVVDAQNDKDFFEVCSLIEQAIRQNHIEGAFTGHFNPLLVAKYQGLADKRIVEAVGDGVNKLGSVKVEFVVPQGFQSPPGITIPQSDSVQDVEYTEVNEHLKVSKDKKVG